MIYTTAVSAAVSAVSRAALCALLGLCLLAGLLPHVAASTALPTFTVTRTADDTAPGSLRGAITQASAVNGTVNFQIPTTDPGVNSTTGAATILLSASLGELDITGSLSIVGPNMPSGGTVAVVAQLPPHPSRVFNVMGGTVSLSNLTIENGYTNGPGGGILNTANLTVANCVLVACVSTNSGGGIANLGGTLTVTDTVINSGGVVSSTGGSSAGPGGGVSSSNGTLSLTRCNITTNSAGTGGGVFSSNDTRMTIMGCMITGNFTASDSGGGGIFATGAAGSGVTMQITNTTVSGNTAGNQGGGGVSFAQGSAAMTNCFVLNNTARTYRISPIGGGILVNNAFGTGPAANLVLTNCVVAANSISNSGSGLANVDGMITAVNCTFTGNQGGGNSAIITFGGAITLLNDILYDGGGLSDVASGPDSNGNPATVTATYSDVQQNMGVFSGVGNINADPQFVRNPFTNGSGDNGDEHLRLTSPAVHTGTNGPGVPLTDIEGTPRPTPPARPSMGAYEVPGASGFSAQGGFTVTSTQNMNTGSQVVAKFLPGATPGSSFTATVDFGDGTGLMAGTISPDPTTAGVLDVTASHTYAAFGTFTITVVISGPGGSPTATVTSTATIQPAQVATDVTSQVVVSRGGFIFNRATRRFVQTVTLKNTGSVAITGPLSLVLDSLTSGAALVTATGTTQFLAPLGSPYQNASVGTLAPGASTSLVLQLTYTGTARLDYSPRVLAGPGTR